MENNRNCSVLCSVRLLCTMICIQIWAVLIFACQLALVFYPLDAMLERVIAMALCLCLSQVGVLSRRMDRLLWVLSWRLLSTSFTPYFKEIHRHTQTHTHTHIHLTAFFSGLPMWAGTRKVKLIWISLKQETMSGSGISWAICKSAPRFIR